MRYGRRAARPESARDVIALDADLATHPAACCPTRPPRRARDERHARDAHPAGARPALGPGRGCGAPRAFVGVVALGLLLVVLLALSAQRPTADLDPEGTGPDGARALAEVLRQQGVDVEVVRSIDALEAAAAGCRHHGVRRRPHQPRPGCDRPARRLGPARPAGSCSLGVDSEQLQLLGLPVEAFGGGGDDLVAGCDSEVARAERRGLGVGHPLRADRTDTGGARCVLRAALAGRRPARPARPGRRLRLGPGAARRAPRPTPTTVVAGLGPAWTNENITDDSHAGTAVRALGSTPRLLWYQPGTADALAPGPGDIAPPDDLSVWPPWTAPAIALLLATVVLLALARGRRLGRLVREPLPVVVRAIETTESRGRLYRRAGDRARAAAVLRVRHHRPARPPARRGPRRRAGCRGARGVARHRAAARARWLTSCSGPPRPTTSP